VIADMQVTIDSTVFWGPEHLPYKNMRLLNKAAAIWNTSKRGPFLLSVD